MINITRKLFVFCFLLMSITKSFAMADQKNTNAIDLLTAFSGKDAKQYEPYFRYSEQAKIVNVEIYAVGNESTTAKYTDEPLPYYEVNNILRITTADGYEAISGVDTYDVTGFKDKHLQELKSISADLTALQTLDSVEVMAILKEKHPDLSNEARASVDIALWDLAARKAGLPLHKLLGSNRSSIEPYASLRYYDTLPEYIAAVEEYAKLGYKKFKFHVWGNIENDVKLVKLVQEKYSGTDYKFLIDFEMTYNLEDALALGRMTDDNLFITFEALIDDSQLEQSAKLKSELGMAIIPAGYNIYSADYIREGIKKDAWDAGRFDATVVGGISQALKLITIANEGDMPIDVQSWGHTLGQAANLHLMLSNERSEYFEASMPKQAFEFGMVNGNILHEGKVVAPEGPGLGIVVDWELLKTADFYRSSN